VQATLAALLLTAAPLAAEFLRVEVNFSGMECASCAASVISRLERMRGVEAVNAALDRGRLEIVLKSGNTLRLDNLRDTVKNAGFTLGLIRVSVRGAAVKEGGEWKFQVEGSDQALRLNAPLEGGVVTVTGAVRGDTFEPEPQAKSK
jgi:copper chaperone CopZ